MKIPNILEIESSMRKEWTYEMFIKLAAGVKITEFNKNKSKIITEITEIIKEILPEIKPETSLHKIIWYRIWLYLILIGLLNCDEFLNRYTSWRKKKNSSGYFEVLHLKPNNPINKNQFLSIFTY